MLWPRAILVSTVSAAMESMWRLVVHAANRSHEDVCGPRFHQKPFTSPYPMKNVLMPIDCVTTGGHVDAGGLYSCLKLRWCTWTGLLTKDIWVSMAYGPEATLISGACATTENHDSVRGPYWKRGPCWRLWSVLPPEVILMSMVQAVARNKVEVHNPCSS